MNTRKFLFLAFLLLGVNASAQDTVTDTSDPVVLFSTLSPQNTYVNGEGLESRKVGGGDGTNPEGWLKYPRRGFKFFTKTHSTDVIGYKITEILVPYDWTFGRIWTFEDGRKEDFGRGGNRWAQFYIHENIRQNAPSARNPNRLIDVPGDRILKFRAGSGPINSDLEKYNLRRHVISQHSDPNNEHYISGLTNVLQPNTKYWLVFDVNCSYYYPKYENFNAPNTMIFPVARAEDIEFSLGGGQAWGRKTTSTDHFSFDYLWWHKPRIEAQIADDKVGYHDYNNILNRGYEPGNRNWRIRIGDRFTHPIQCEIKGYPLYTIDEGAN